MSQELILIKKYFNLRPMIDINVASLIESYIYFDKKEFDENGKLKCEYKTRFGLKDGEYKQYFDNGNLQIKVNYKNGERNGILRHYNINKRLIAMTKYKNGKEIFRPNYENQIVKYYFFGNGRI